MLGRSGATVRTTLGMLLIGDYGTHKSSIALESLKLQIPEVVNKKNVLRNSRVLYIDIENGSIDSYLEKYEEDGYNLNNIYIVYTQSFSDTSDLIKRIKNNEDFYVFDEVTGEETDEVALDADNKPFRPDIIVIDGLALLYHAREQQYVKFSEKRAKVKVSTNKELTTMAKEVVVEGADLEFKEYKKLQFDGNQIIADLIGCGKHWVVTCFAQDEKKEELGYDGKVVKDKNGSAKKVRTGNFITEGFKDLVKYCKTVVYLYEDEDTAEIKGLIQRKDRSMVFPQGEIIENPSLLMWQPALTKNIDKKMFSVSNHMQEAIQEDMKIDSNPESFNEKEVSKNNNTSDSADTKTPSYYHDMIIDKINATPKSSMARKEVASKLKKLGVTNTNLKTISDIELLKKCVEEI